MVTVLVFAVPKRGTAKVPGGAGLEVCSTVTGASFGNLVCVVVRRKLALGKKKISKIKKQVTRLLRPG